MDGPQSPRVAGGRCWGPVLQPGTPSTPLGALAESWQRLPQGKPMDFVDVSESHARWVQDFRLKPYASPAKLESIDGET